MKLLICTQAVDRQDPILGFFHRWVEEFARRSDQITVLCLREGTHALPSNVTVYSLGKFKIQNSKFTERLSYAFRFLSYIWRLRRQYDTVFVHMNQEYVLLGGWLWQLLGTPIYFWRNHPKGSVLTDLAALFCTKIFCTSKFSYTAKFKKTIRMPVGIDTELFRPQAASLRHPYSILFLGRIAPVKRPDVLLKALKILADKKISFTASMYGSPLPKDGAYDASLKKFSKDYHLPVEFHGGVPNAQTPAIYRAHQIFVNLSPSGMFDKTILEAAACECLIATSHEMLKEVVGEGFFEEGDAQSLAEALERLLAYEPEKTSAEGRRLRAFVEEQHSLSLLGEQLFTTMSSSIVLR